MPDQLELASLHDQANKSSMAAQLRFLRCGAAILICSIGAAILATLTVTVSDGSFLAGPIGGSILFAIAFGVTVFLGYDRPDQRWYDGRAVAESVKTLAWEYAVGGGPFSFAADTHVSAEDLFTARLKSVTETRPAFRFGGTPNEPSSQITDSMKAMRCAGLSERREAYARLRLADQRSWYGQKAEWNQQRATRWFIASLVLQGLGVAGGLLAGFEWVDYDFLGVAAAGVAAVAAWLQTRDHLALAEAYDVTARELVIVETRAGELPDDEKAWGAFVDDAEQAISREHTLWLARRGSITSPG